MKKLLLLLSVMAVTTVQAQKMKVVSGNFDFLKGQSELNVVMDYSSTKFYKENMDEAAYIEKHENDILKAGKDESEVEYWNNNWAHAKESKFPSKFIALMNKNCQLKTSEHNTKAKYTLRVETVWIYPGWYAGVMMQPAKVSTVLKFVETANPSVVLLEITSENAPGTSAVDMPSNNDRIAEGYAKTAKTLAALINKRTK